MSRALMVRVMPVVLLAAAVVRAEAPEGEVLTNEKVMLMAKAGLSEDIVLRKISEAVCDFSTKAEDLVALKEAGVTNAVITAMMDREKVQEESLDRRIQMLIQTLRTAKKQEYRRAVRELTRLGARAVPKLLRSLSNPDELVRGGVAEVLGEIGDGRAMQPLLDMFDDEHPGVRANAAQAIAKMPGEDSVRKLLAMIEKGGPRRDGPALCLGYLKEKKAIKPLVALMQDPLAGTDDRASSAFALGLIGDAAALDALVVEVTASRVPRLRESAAKAVARIGPYYGAMEKLKAAKALDEAYKRFPHSRTVIAEAMGEFPIAQVIETLIDGLNDQNPDVVDACYESLKHATGEVFDRDFEQWSSWFQLTRARFEVSEEAAGEPEAGEAPVEPGREDGEVVPVEIPVVPLEKAGE